MKTLLTQDEVYAPLLLKFLDSTDNARIAWVQDIATKRYEHAAQSLLKESEHEPKLAEKQVCLRLSPASLQSPPSDAHPLTTPSAPAYSAHAEHQQALPGRQPQPAGQPIRSSAQAAGRCAPLKKLLKRVAGR
jgi:hypothetical protein